MAYLKTRKDLEADILSRILLGDAPSPLPYVQESPFPEPSKEYFRKILEEKWQFNGKTDSWDELAVDEHETVPPIERELWREPLLARYAVEPVLPTPSGDVRFKEVEVEDDGPSNIYDHALRQYVQTDNQTMSIIQGAPVDQLTTQTSRAHDEAESGLWTEELKSRKFPVTYAPGMDTCLFGMQSGKEGSQREEGYEGEDELGGLDSRGPVKTEQDTSDGQEIKYSDILSGLWVVDEADDEDGAQDEQEQEQGANGNLGTTPVEVVSQLRLLDDLEADSLEKEGGDASTVDSEGFDDIPFIQPSTSAQPPKASSEGPKVNEWAVMDGIKDLEEAYSQIKGSMAMHFPFELDKFQKEAICNLEKGRSVFVAAHTSAGKTVVAEYAFALATKHCTRAVYTSPIKTISNQKFRDFSGKFEVGLMTGDVQIRPNAPCLIMTTEILRSMLYKGADLIRDMEFVIFDEVHYVNDADRGVVWEETIIMLPPHCSIVLLSATVPNVEDFAGWVGRTKRKEVYVSATQKRPVPLEHSLFYANKLYSICKGDKYTSDGLQRANLEYQKKKKPSERELAAMEAQGRGRGRGGNFRGGGDYHRGRDHGRGNWGGRGGGGRGKGNRSKINRDLLQLLKNKELLPTVIFAFSKKWCDHAGRDLSAIDLTTSREKHEIHVFCEKALSRLNDTDRQLPQILRIKNMLKRGIAVHHAGLLPIIKEIVEMLFCRGLVQVLFATETFAMGVNAPARAVVFNSLEKHDGQEFRTLLAGEYTQMAGRAGRRGLDEVGTVIICCIEELPEERDLRKLLKGRGLQLTSRFRLTYSMILNLMRVEDLKVEDMLKRSFAEHHAQKAQPGNIAQVEKAENTLKYLRGKDWPHCHQNCSRDDLEDYFKLTVTIRGINEKNSSNLMRTFHTNKKIQEALKVSQTVLVCDPKSGLLATGVICGAGQGIKGKSGGSGSKVLDRVLQVLSLHRKGPWDKEMGLESEEQGIEPSEKLLFRGTMVGKNANGWGPLPQFGKKSGAFFRLADVEVASIIQVFKDKVDVGDILKNSESSHLAPVVKKLKDMEEKLAKERITTIDAKLGEGAADWKYREKCIGELFQTPCHRYTCFTEKYAIVSTEHTLRERLLNLRHSMSDATLKQMPEFQNRVRVLEEMGYVDETGTVKLKGRVACEINSGDEMVATEMIFTGFLAELDPEEAVALVSAFVFQEKTSDQAQLTPRLYEACRNLNQLCWHCAVTQQEHGLDIDPKQYCEETLNFGLVQVVYQWAKGTPFKEICSLTSIMEGSIVRTIVRLEQACREIMDAARVMGNTSLFVKMQQASGLIRRDVIFAASLYVS